MRKYHFYASCFLALVVSLFASSPGRSFWVSGGVLVSAGGSHREPKIVEDGRRGAIISWCDNSQTYVQRVDFYGICKWTIGGIRLSSSGTAPQIEVDGAGGAVIAWQDVRNGNLDIYVQKVDSSGAVIWSSGGVEVCAAAGNQESPFMTTDCSGGAIIAWEDEREDNKHIYAQKIDSGGNAIWAPDGVRIDTTDGIVYGPDIDSDEMGGAYITWMTLDTATTEYLERKIFLAKIDSDGHLAWDPHEVTCDTWPAQWPGIEWSFPRVTRDKCGGAIVAWAASLDNLVFYVLAQKVNSQGLACWEEGGVSVTLDVLCHGVQLKPDGLGGAAITWLCMANIWIAEWDIMAGRIDSDGSMLWIDHVFGPVNGPDFATGAWEYNLNDDGRGRFFIAWPRGFYLDEDMLWRFDIYANRLNRDGVMWLGKGLPVCPAAGEQVNAQIVSAGDGSSITVWEDTRGDGSIYAQLLNAWGEPPIETLLQNHRSLFDGEKAVIEWTLSEAGEAMRFYVLRAEGDESTFESIPNPIIAQADMTFAFADWTCGPGTIYIYRVNVEDERGLRLLFESDPVAVPPMPLVLYQNRPNPFNPNTMIGYYLPESGRVVLEVYSVTGRKIIELVTADQVMGRHDVEWDGKDADGKTVGSGIYFSRLMADKKVVSRKLVLIR